jgi:hypothetical protein
MRPGILIDRCSTFATSGPGDLVIIISIYFQGINLKHDVNRALPQRNILRHRNKQTRETWQTKKKLDFDRLGEGSEQGNMAQYIRVRARGVFCLNLVILCKLSRQR